jgi:hypothetical protein
MKKSMLDGFISQRTKGITVTDSIVYADADYA